MNLKEVLKFINNLFFPSVCEGCGEVGAYICDRCIKKKFKFKEAQECHVCKKSIYSGFVHKKCRNKTNLDGVFIIAHYSKFIENYIGDIKYEFYFAMIDDLVKVMNFALKKSKKFEKIIDVSILTFAPLHTRRRRWRGFNQAEEIAKGISKYWNSPCMKLLKRKKSTKCQVGLKKKERLVNLNNAFEYIQGNDSRKSSVIIDDVMTTGSTLEECAKVLKKSGIKRVYGLVFARG